MVVEETSKNQALIYDYTCDYIFRFFSKKLQFCDQKFATDMDHQLLHAEVQGHHEHPVRNLQKKSQRSQ